MTSDPASAATPIGLGLRALRGGAVVVGVAAEAGQPRVVLSSFLATAAGGDRLSLEPYLVAAEMKRGPNGEASAEAAAAVAEGRKRQDQLAANGLGEIVRKVRDAGCEPIVAALLLNRAGWITDLLAYSLSAPEHPPVAEGLAVREALRFALGRVGVQAVELDEKSLPERASEELGISPADLDARLKALGAEVGPPWRKEQKLACLAAWFALVTAP
ncbi:MAG TPA: hypothetical protein VGI22_07650 [Xanthobacteraceae bacterium]|jgi:hypothetical protein